VKTLARLFAVAAIATLTALPGARAAEPSFPTDQIMGRPDAPLTIVEYASTTCGHCASFHKNTLPRLKAEWIDTGRAKLIFRDYPTAPQSVSVGASMIPHCAGPDRYFGLLGLIMDQQERWMSAANPLVELKKLSKLAGLGEDKVDECLRRKDLSAAIETRARDAYERLGIDGTPAFVIDGKVIPGARPFEDFDKALKAATK
jgi:protein-disulfide isomerase